MTCGRSTYSPGQGEDCLQTSFLDMIPSAPLNGTPIVAKSSGNEPPKDGSQTCKCLREMFGCSLHPTGKDEWIASMRDSLASLTPSLESARARMMIETSGRRPQESLGRFDRLGSFSKTSLDLFPTGSSGQSSVTWTASGMMRDGRCWELTRLVPRTGETDGFVLPTPRAEGMDAMGSGRHAKDSLIMQARMLPTPAARDWRGANSMEQLTRGGRAHMGQLPNFVKMWPTPRGSGRGRDFGKKNRSPGGEDLPTVVHRLEPGGQLNPTWVGLLMGFPLNWTEVGMVKRKPVISKPCDTCGKEMERKLYGERLEDFQCFMRRRFCSLTCANTREVVGYHGQSWRARQHLGQSCERCGGTEMLAAHHLDENRSNNTRENIQTLCVTCHSWWHHEAKRRGIRPCGKAVSLA